MTRRRAGEVGGVQECGRESRRVTVCEGEKKETGRGRERWEGGRETRIEEEGRGGKK